MRVKRECVIRDALCVMREIEELHELRGVHGGGVFLFCGLRCMKHCAECNKEGGGVYVATCVAGSAVWGVVGAGGDLPEYW
jgi:hypothetical protein